MHSLCAAAASASAAAGPEATCIFTVPAKRTRSAVSTKLLRKLLLAGVFLMTVGHLPLDHTGCLIPFNCGFQHKSKRNTNGTGSSARSTTPQHCLPWKGSLAPGSGHFLPVSLVYASARAAYTANSSLSLEKGSQQATGSASVPSEGSNERLHLSNAVLATDAIEPGMSSSVGAEDDVVPVLSPQGTLTGLYAPRTATGHEAVSYIIVPEGEGRQPHSYPATPAEQQQNQQVAVVEQLADKTAASGPILHWTAGAGGLHTLTQQGSTTPRSAHDFRVPHYKYYPREQQLPRFEPRARMLVIDEHHRGPKLTVDSFGQWRRQPQPPAGEEAPLGRPYTGGNEWDLYSHGEHWRSRRNRQGDEYYRRHLPMGTRHSYWESGWRDTPARGNGRRRWEQAGARARRYSSAAEEADSETLTRDSEDYLFADRRLFKPPKGKALPSRGGRTARERQCQKCVSREAAGLSEIAASGEEEDEDTLGSKKAALETLRIDKLVANLLERMGLPAHVTQNIGPSSAGPDRPRPYSQFQPNYEPALPAYHSPEMVYQPVSPIIPSQQRTYQTTSATYPTPLQPYQPLQQYHRQRVEFPTADTPAAGSTGFYRGSPSWRFPPNVAQEQMMLQQPSPYNSNTTDNFSMKLKHLPGTRRDYGRVLQHTRKGKLNPHRGLRQDRRHNADKRRYKVVGRSKQNIAKRTSVLNVVAAAMVLAAAIVVLHGSPALQVWSQKVAKVLNSQGITDTEEAVSAADTQPGPLHADDGMSVSGRVSPVVLHSDASTQSGPKNSRARSILAELTWATAVLLLVLSFWNREHLAVLEQ